MSGGLATLLQPPSPLSVPCRPGRARELSADYEEHCAGPTEDGLVSATIFAPTPLVKIARFQDIPEPGTPKALAGSEIESILAEKGTTGENLICAFPKIQSSEDFTRLVTHGDMPSSPLLAKSTSISGLDDMPLGFPMRARSLLDLSNYDLQAYEEEEEEGTPQHEFLGTLPPTRSLNPLKNLLHPFVPPRCISRMMMKDPRVCDDSPPTPHRQPFGAELGLDGLSPPLEVVDC
eukprot:TRINITY_DN42254_c0_g1_i1.p1 TRINITY_DN42254_c0_g1~~TRINITY_DN42254_c0_g1_i1.p1  ORF type:complete len:234 (+),score=32.10 TRINITY_DN42254_c0_g1_i1:258-959(+)